MKQDHRDADIYRRYAVGMYRQAIFSALPHIRASRMLRRLITSPARRRRGRQPNSPDSRRNDADAQVRHDNHHGNHARPDSGQIMAGCAALYEDAENVTVGHQRAM